VSVQGDAVVPCLVAGGEVLEFVVLAHRCGSTRVLLLSVVRLDLAGDNVAEPVCITAFDAVYCCVGAVYLRRHVSDVPESVAGCLYANASSCAAKQRLLLRVRKCEALQPTEDDWIFPVVFSTLPFISSLC